LKPIHTRGKIKIDSSDIESLDKNFASNLSEAVRFETISSDSGSVGKHRGDFIGFIDFLQKKFPLVHTHLTKETIDSFSLLYTWKGQNPKLEPVLLIAHMDVVPIDTGSAKKWTEPPFSGAIKNGYLWGRGSMDDKANVLGLLEAIEALLKNGYKPQRDIYIAFGHDEECSGKGAAAISAVLKSRGMHFQYILDEGGGIIDGAIPYVDHPVAFIGIAEKGYLTLQLDVKGSGGHSSMPLDEGVVGILGKAIYRLEDHPFHTRLTSPVRQMFRELGKYMPGINGFIAIHPVFFSGILRKEMSAYPITNSLVQTTIAPTMMSCGIQENMMPTSARMIVNFRILPGETVQSVMARVKWIIHDKRIAISIIDAWNPSKIALIKAKSYKVLRHSIEEVFPKTGVAPILNVSISDSRNYSRLSNNILHFVPLVTKQGDSERIHGVNERISISNYKECIAFYYRFIINSDLEL
jgi:carboxypeptidase PM20D1